MIAIGAEFLALLTRELALLAATGFLIGGLDDLAVDLIWLARGAWRRLTVDRHDRRITAATLPPPRDPGRLALFVPAWREAEVIWPMLRATLGRYDHGDYRIYVGTYPNDPATIAAVEQVDDPRVRLVHGLLDGPTTKAECLNRMWAAMLLDERCCGFRYKAVVLHDAEDVVHPLELRLFDALIERFDLIQLPVQPLIDPGSRWVSAHYADEFAEAHAKQLVVREALGAGIPSAGVGCALSRGVLARMADAADGKPFDEASLTEDYELGLRLAGFGGRATFVAMPAAPGAPLVAVRAFFPGSFDIAVRQKARWMQGIALAGWDRLGWHGSLAERWMRLRDRRAVLAAILLTAGYAAALLLIITWPFGLRYDWPGWIAPVLTINFALLAWRLAVRVSLVGRLYGWREGLRAIPRVFVGNVIAIAAARRAVMAYDPGATPRWDKTAHQFPDAMPCD